jgi:hypothetical protein
MLVEAVDGIMATINTFLVCDGGIDHGPRRNDASEGERG